MVELVVARGSDMHLYSVRSVIWNLEKVESCWDRISRFGIFSDNMPKNAMGFLAFVMAANAIWFEVFDLDLDQPVGLMYLTDMVAGADNRMVEATWHAMVWDAHAGIRRPVFRAAIKALFEQLGFHRLRTEIPMKFGGTIRQAKRIGFIPEGFLRESVLYNGVWFNSMILSVLNKEAASWE